MKYILLDTNIVIDMVIDRRNQVSDSLLASFIRLLDFDEITLIVPEIVKVETLRHLDEELESVGKRINKVMNDIDALYGVATYTVAGLDIKEYKAHSRQELAKAYDMYQKNVPKYKEDLIKTINMVFEHRNSVFIACDDFLSNAVTKRRIYKRAPFHIVQKDSFGDGLITETLINIGKYVSLESSDEVLFVTGNYTDFCVGKAEKTTLLPDIVEDIKAAGVPCQVKCINTFGQLIGKDLNENVRSANLSAEFAKELQEQYEADMEQYALDVQNMDRASADLTPMDGYAYKLEQELIDSDFVTSIIELFDELNRIYRCFEYECNETFYEELEDYVKLADVSGMYDILVKFKRVFDEYKFLPDIGCAVPISFTTEDVLIVLEWLESQRNMMKMIAAINLLPDNIQYGDTIEIVNTDLEPLKFCLDNLYLSPEEGSDENINIGIYAQNGDLLAKGCISVTYGFIEFDDDGCAGDGLSDEITYNYELITRLISDIIKKWKLFSDEQIEIANMLMEEFE